MTQFARHRGPITPRWVRGILTGTLLAVVATSNLGCGLSYVFRNISPLRPTGWSFAWPILPSQQQRLERDMEREEADRVPILDPIVGEFAPATCLDPPSEQEVWNKVTKFKNGSPPFYETQRNNVRFLIEKIGDKIDPCKVYPLAGPCQLVHCHYKCTIYFDESYWSDYPIPFNHVDHRVEVVYIDKDHLRRCGGPPVATTPP
ncbi:hypothetical protein SAMN05444166_6652 [Singulisphaera sp. GP187]|uniref:hypothetical protein n=1 Tax=Singulisphaera sp. GP187 TaxID=1882752 RepID=UPI000927A6CF|nr:hypothetical protein [Singulisphaera sp. GP187]SIO61135.1 hypothetical protein SAMN05444166_6652 [Singulisphaera sp. GP187]